MSAQRHAWWAVFAVLVAGTWTFSACGSSTTISGTNGSGDTTATPDSGGSSGDPGSSSGGPPPPPPSGGSSSGDASADGNATPANFKVAFIGDTSTGQDFKDVLALIKREGAQAVFVQGDVEYGGDTAATWIPVIDNALLTGGTYIPYFVARGNHDADWTQPSGLGAAMDTRMTTFGATEDDAKPSATNYAFTYKGLKVVMVNQVETTNPTRADYVKTQLANDTHIWKICSWHKNMRDTNVGPKGDEMGWTIYENCRAAGAIVAQGHSHTYSRSKTMTADQALTVDPACSDPFSLCVGPGKHFFFDSSLGGVELRTLENTAKAHWASYYSSDYGALFVEFNVDGDPRKAKGYFKNVANVVVDPPANSGKTFFTITSAN